MKISIVTAVLNRVDTIGAAIDSVHRQNFPHVEHVIQDGGSTDGTLEVLQSRLRRKDSLVSCRDSGLYDAINRGIDRASGDVIGLMHADDFFADDSVLDKVNLAFQDYTVDGVYGDLQYVSLDARVIIRHWRAGELSAGSLKLGWMPPHPTLFLRRDVFERFGKYDVNFSISADYEAMIRYITNGIRLKYLPEVLVKMRIGGESNRSIGRMVLKSREDFIAIRRHGLGGFSTLFMKNVRKIPQFTFRFEEGA